MNARTRVALGAAAFTLAALIAIVGYGYPNHWQYNLDGLLNSFSANLSVDLLSIAITVLVIDWLNQRRITKETQQELVLQMGSTHADVADEAIRRLRARGWLTDGTLTDAFLAGANLNNANLSGAVLQRANLLGANLVGAKLVQANLEGAQLGSADLEGCKLTEANLQNCDLRVASLKNANLMKSDLRGANLKSADLQSANLIGADFRDAAVEGASFDRSIYDCTTRWPVSFAPPSSATRIVGNTGPDSAS